MAYVIVSVLLGLCSWLVNAVPVLIVGTIVANLLSLRKK